MGSKPQQETRLLEIIEETQTDLVVLARYMQILSDTLSEALSDTLCEALNGRASNIHHSFLRVSRAPGPITRPTNGA